MKKLTHNKSILKIFLFIFIIIICYWCSQNICYYYLDDIAVIYLSQLYQFLILRIILSNVFFFLINYIFQIFDINYKYILKYCFILILLSTVLLTLRPATMRAANFNITDIDQIWNGQQGSRMLLIANILLYAPLGFIYYKITHEKTILAFIDFLIFISLVELCQYYLKLGIFDIYDIFFNTMGFLIGFLFSKLLVYLIKQRRFKNEQKKD